MNFKELIENSLYKTSAEKDALEKDKDKIAEAFVYNFLGIIGLINATSMTQHSHMKSAYFSRDKKVQLANIGDDNNDISLVIKLVNDAGFFKNATIPLEITRFLAKLKQSAVDEIDNKVILKWLDALKPEFFTHIKDPQTKRHVLDYIADAGVSYDISKLAIKLKSRVNKVDMGGEFKLFSKQFGALTEKPIIQPVVQSQVVQSVSTKRKRRTKAEMQALRASLNVVPNIQPVTKIENASIITNKIFDMSLSKSDLDADNKFVLSFFNSIKDKIKAVSEYKVKDYKQAIDELVNLFNTSNIFKNDFSANDIILNIDYNDNEFNKDLYNEFTTLNVLETKEKMLGRFNLLSDSSLDNKDKLIKTMIDKYVQDKNYLNKKLSYYDTHNVIIMILYYHFNNKPAIEEILNKNDDYNNRRIIEIPHTYNTIYPKVNNIISKEFKKWSDAYNKKYFFEVMSFFINSKYNGIYDSYINKLALDIENNGVEKFTSTRDYNNTIEKALIKMGINLNLLSDKFPNDKKLKEYIFNSTNEKDLTPKDIFDHIDDKSTMSLYKEYNDNTNRFADKQYIDYFGSNLYNLFNNKISDKTKIVEAFSIALTKKNLNQKEFFKQIYRLFPSLDKEHIDLMISNMKKNDFKSFYDQEIYKETSRRDAKEEFISSFTRILFDTIGTSNEDYISDILEEMPGNIVGRIKNSIIGMRSFVDEVKNGKINTFDKIDDKRLRQMLTMNNIDLSSLVKKNIDLPRKRKNQKWTEYLDEVKKIADKSDNSVLGKEKVTSNSDDLKALTKKYDSLPYYAGRHGNIHTKIVKSFDADIKFPEFDDFRKNNPKSEKITPAFHGTGGIAASMILRYGFKIISATDKSVVGRMLGNGIYFSNKIDKALQYVGNNGYGRGIGTKGYIFEMDTTIGVKNKDYNAKGLGNDNILSPEWCVFNPRAQLSIYKVYEVELVTSDGIKKYLKEETSFKGFKQFMKTDTSITSFIIRDGLIPILDIHNNVSYLDFEDAVNKLPKNAAIDYTMAGPVIVFKNTKNQENFDIRFGQTMGKTIFDTYKKCWNNK